MNMWRCRWISWIWFCVIDLSEDPLLNKDLRYLVVLQPSFRNPLLQELLLSGTHYQTPSPHWLRYHPSEANCLLHHARRRAHSIAEISVRRLAIIIQIQHHFGRPLGDRIDMLYMQLYKAIYKANYSAFEFTLNSPIVSYRMQGF